MKQFNDDPNYGDEYYSTPLLISKCCGAISLGEVHEDAYGNQLGLCSDCRDWTDFEQETDDDRPMTV